MLGKLEQVLESIGDDSFDNIQVQFLYWCTAMLQKPIMVRRRCSIHAGDVRIVGFVIRCRLAGGLRYWPKVVISTPMASRLSMVSTISAVVWPGAVSGGSWSPPSSDAA